MERMLAVLGSADPAFLFTHLFLRQLPAPVRTALVSSSLSTTKDYRKLAAEADRIFLANRQQVAHALLPGFASPLPAPQENPDSNCTLGQRWANEVTGTAAAVAARRHQHDSSSHRDSGMCYYHSRYGAKAKQCRSPCNFNLQGNARAGARSQL